MLRCPKNAIFNCTPFGPDGLDASCKWGWWFGSTWMWLVTNHFFWNLMTYSIWSPIRSLGFRCFRTSYMHHPHGFNPSWGEFCNPIYMVWIGVQLKPVDSFGFDVSWIGNSSPCGPNGLILHRLGFMKHMRTSALGFASQTRITVHSGLDASYIGIYKAPLWFRWFIMSCGVYHPFVNVFDASWIRG